MPNWCSNYITINHPDSEMMDKVIEASAEEKLGDMFYPVPPCFAEDWYNWRVKNWGTKWDFGCTELTKADNGSCSGYFDTAWSPPVEFYRYMMELGFSIEAYYHESGMSFAGSYIDGSNETYQYDNIDNIPQNIIDLFNIMRDDDEEEELEDEPVK